jgi:serine phosphatase RsbU (regulator of sigma subunit)
MKFTKRVCIFLLQLYLAAQSDRNYNDTLIINNYIKVSNTILETNADSAIYLLSLAKRVSDRLPVDVRERFQFESLINLAYAYHVKNKLDAAILQMELLERSLKQKINSDTDKRNFYLYYLMLTNDRLGIFYRKKSQISRSLECHNKAAMLADSLPQLENNKKAVIYANASNCYSFLKLYSKSISFALKSMKIFETSGDFNNYFKVLNNIAIIYYQAGNINKSLEYAYKQLKIINQNPEIDTRKKIITYNILGLIMSSNKKYDSALYYFNRILELSSGDENFIKDRIYAINNLGNLYLSISDTIQSQSVEAQKRKNMYLNKSLKFFLESLAYDKAENNLYFLQTDYSNLGLAYLKLNKTHLSEKYLNAAEELYVKKGINSEIISTYMNKYLLYKKMKKHDLALRYFEKYNKMKDSIFNDENKNSIYGKELQFNYMYKLQADSIEFVKQKEIMNLNLLAREEKIKREKYVILFLALVVSVIMIFSYILYKRYQIIRYQNTVIEAQKLIVEQKNKDITDSIKYAKRIQDAILPSPQKWKEHLPESFILYMPKDIIAGDFYWMEVLGNNIYVAAADCTGHGVPGAMVSVVCSNALTKVVLEEKTMNTDEILNRVREIVIEKLTSEDNIKDGMDICLIRLTKNSSTIQFSGANRPLYVVSSSSEYTTGNSDAEGTEATDLKLFELKPDKQPIGRYEEKNAFSKQEIALPVHSTLFLTTDGYADQFGGERGKKIGTGAFKDLLKKSSELKNPEEQKEYLFTFFKSWKSSEEQTDDVTVIGIQI